MSDVFGPGHGTLLVHMMSTVDKNADRYHAELQQMRRELRAKIAGGLRDQAMAQAAADLSAEIVAEQEAIEAGKLKARRLSDPANVEVRNAEFAKRTASNLSRLGSGRLRLTIEDQAKLRAKRLVR